MRFEHQFQFLWSSIKNTYQRRQRHWGPGPEWPAGRPAGRTTVRPSVCPADCGPAKQPPTSAYYRHASQFIFNDSHSPTLGCIVDWMDWMDWRSGTQRAGSWERAVPTLSWGGHTDRIGWSREGFSFAGLKTALVTTMRKCCKCCQVLATTIKYCFIVRSFMTRILR